MLNYDGPSGVQQYPYLYTSNGYIRRILSISSIDNWNGRPALESFGIGGKYVDRHLQGICDGSKCKDRKK